MGINKLKKRKEPDAENVWLKRVYAELAILSEALKKVIGKKDLPL